MENTHLDRLKSIFQSFGRKIILSTLTFEHPEKTLLTLKLKKDEEVILRLSIPSILISDRFINVSSGFRASHL